MNRKFKKGLAIVLALAMVFAMTATAFASTNDNITVTVRFDTRSYDLSAKMLKSDAQIVRWLSIRYPFRQGVRL